MFSQGYAFEKVWNWQDYNNQALYQKAAQKQGCQLVIFQHLVGNANQVLIHLTEVN